MILKDENGNILVDGAQVLKDSENIGTIVKVGGQAQTEVGFTSDPQQQISANKSALDKKLDKTQCTLDFNQLFDANKSTLPSGSGLTITNIYGGHHIEGTTTSQFYHKMYSVYTIFGHQYYFAANFSEKANVYIVGETESTRFNTKDEKIFTGGQLFYITLQIERDKVISTDLKPILVDLTRMFGEGNEPQTTQEVQEYLVKGTYYPYNDKPNRDVAASKKEANSLSMCPSNTWEDNFITRDEITNSDTGYEGDARIEKDITHNGFVHVAFSVYQESTSITLFKGKSDTYHAFGIGGKYNANSNSECKLLIPVKAGDHITLSMSKKQNMAWFECKFIYSVEV